MEVSYRIEIFCPVGGIFEELADGGGAFEVDYWHVGLDGGTVESCSSGFATGFAGFVPGGGADCEALGGGDDGVKGMEGGTGDEGGLVSYPDVTDRVEGVGKNNSLRIELTRRLSFDVNKGGRTRFPRRT